MNKSVSSNRYVISILTLLIVFLSFSQIRQLHESSIYGSTELRIYFVYAQQLFSAALFIEFIRKNNFFRLNFSESIIFSYPILSMLLIAVNDVDYKISYTLTDVIMPIFFIAIISLFKNNNFSFDSRGFIFSIFFYFSIFILTIIIAQNIQLSYNSLASIQIVFVLSYLLVFNIYFRALLLIIFIFLSGKRGVFAGAFLSLGIFSHAKYKGLFYAFVLLVATFLMFLNLDEVVSSMGILKKFNYENFSNADIGYMEFFLGPRYYEVKGSMSNLLDNPLLFLTGNGSGFFYYSEHPSEGYITRHNVHISPIGILTTYGAIYAIILYAYLIKVLFRAINKIQQSRNKWQVVWSLYFIAAFLNSFTVYSIFIDTLFAVSIGVILNKNTIKKCVE
jgi:hypothetical protein